MIYIDAAKLLDMIDESGKSQKDFCNDAGITSQALYRLIYHGGPVMISTATKVSNALGVSVALLLDRQRTPPQSTAGL